MNIQFRKYIRFFGSILIVVMLIAGVSSVSAASVAPVFIDGNPDCQDIGLGDLLEQRIEFGADAQYNGTFPIGGYGTVTIVVTAGGTINWTSTVGIDAVMMKGSSGANVYIYSPESFGDNELVTPTNASGSPAGISHINFCYDIEPTVPLEVSKTAQTTYTRTYTWTIDKSVTPASVDLFAGESMWFDYTIGVTRTENDTNFAVSGSIQITNPNASASAFISGVSDVLSDGTVATVNCGVTFPYILAPLGVLNCSYSASVLDTDAGTNTAAVSTTGVVAGASSDPVAYAFGDPTTIVGDPSVALSDSVEGSIAQVLNDTSQFTYSQNRFCATDTTVYTNGFYSIQFPNTATITGANTNLSDNASVTVNCYLPSVTKSAQTSYDRTWLWAINKLASEDSVVLQPGGSQTFDVNYYIVVQATSSDSNFATTGLINVYNPHPSRSLTVDVRDVVDANINAVVDCGGGSTQLVIAPASLGVCTFSTPLPTGSDTTNTAYARYQTELMSAPFEVSGTAPVDFGEPTNFIDECITINDAIMIDGIPVNLGANISFPIVFCAPYTPNIANGRYLIEYRRTLGPFECGNHLVNNVASFITNDTGATGSNDHNITVTVNCVYGCTLTQGYWKTHSIYGPAAHPDDGWYAIGVLGPDTPFFLSGKTWYEVFWTAPAGNRYYNLAQQYMAAKLNLLNGASSTLAVNTAITGAESFFATYAPGSTLNRTVRQQIITWAGTLGSYNEGLIGPGHCSDDATRTYSAPR